VAAKKVICFAGVLKAKAAEKSKDLKACIDKTYSTSHLDMSYPGLPNAAVCDVSPVANKPCDEAFITAHYEASWSTKAPAVKCVPCAWSTPPAPTPEGCQDCHHTFGWRDGWGQTGAVAYSGPCGMTVDDFDTCVDVAAATGTLAEGKAALCQKEFGLGIRVLRRSDTNEIIGYASCCNTYNTVTSHSTACQASSQCAHVGPGACATQYYAGWDGEALTLDECMELCVQDVDCGFISFCSPDKKNCAGQGHPGTCSRYRKSSKCSSADLSTSTWKRTLHESYDCRQQAFPKIHPVLVNDEALTMSQMQTKCPPGFGLVELQSADHVRHLASIFSNSGGDWNKGCGAPLAYKTSSGPNRYASLADNNVDVTAYLQSVYDSHEIGGDLWTVQDAQDIAGFGWGHEHSVANGAGNHQIHDFTAGVTCIQMVFCEEKEKAASSLSLFIDKVGWCKSSVRSQKLSATKPEACAAECLEKSDCYSFEWDGGSKCNYNPGVKNPDGDGKSGKHCYSRACCMSMTADCLACRDGTSKEEYCKKKPDTDGCKPQATR